MTDDFESSLRTSLQTISVAHDDVRADAMIGAATAATPLPGRHAVLGPLAAAAAVIALGAAVAITATGGGGSAPTGPPAGGPPGTATRARHTVPIEVSYRFVAAPSHRQVPSTLVTYPVPVIPSGSFDPGSYVAVDRFVVANPNRDDATIRVTRDGATVFTVDVAGHPTSSTAAAIPARAAAFAATVQCHRPGRGGTCRLGLKIIGTQDLTRAFPSAPPSSPLSPSTTP